MDAGTPHLEQDQTNPLRASNQTITAELVGQLRKNANGEDKVRELLRVPRMREHLKNCERELQTRPASARGGSAM